MKLTLFTSSAQQLLINARRIARDNGHDAIGSHELLAACLADDEILALLGRAGISREDLPVESIDRTDDELLRSIGIDPQEMRNRLPSSPRLRATRLRLRRRLVRPLQITLESPSMALPFRARGREILEIAARRSRRNRRPADPIDLMAGILADATDPACQTVVTAAGGQLHSLVDSVYSPRQTAN